MGRVDGWIDRFGTLRVRARGPSCCWRAETCRRSHRDSHAGVFTPLMVHGIPNEDDIVCSKGVEMDRRILHARSDGEPHVATEADGRKRHGSRFVSRPARVQFRRRPRSNLHVRSPHTFHSKIFFSRFRTRGCGNALARTCAPVSPPGFLPRVWMGTWPRSIAGCEGGILRDCVPSSIPFRRSFPSPFGSNRKGIEPKGDRTLSLLSIPNQPGYVRMTLLSLGGGTIPGRGWTRFPPRRSPPFKGHRRPVRPMGQPHRMHPHTFTLRACAATDARGATIARRWRSETGTGIAAEGVEGSPGRVEGDTNDAVAWERGERPRPRTCRRRPGRV